MSDKLHILQHSLGVGDYGDKPSHRNHFVTGPGSTDYGACSELVEDGLMRRHSMNKALTGGDDCFIVTPEGIDFVALNSPKRPKLSRSKQRYLDYLHSDCCESFGEWLKYGMWKTA